jgi:hypothetical protein
MQFSCQLGHPPWEISLGIPLVYNFYGVSLLATANILTIRLRFSDA